MAEPPLRCCGTMDTHEIESVIVPENERLDSLMVILSDRLSELIGKGEVVPRYYNPGNLFRTVHIVLCNDDRPDPAQVQSMVGSARLELHSFPGGIKMFLLTLAWRPALLRLWARPIVELARRVKPQLVRCHVNNINAFVASEIKRRLGIPYVLSLHINPDTDVFHRGQTGGSWRWRLLGRAIEGAETVAVRQADFVLPVYSPIVSYLRRRGVRRYEIVYNAVGHGVIAAKTGYAINHKKVRAVCVGRQLAGAKDPSTILEAIADLPAIHLTLVGDGDLHASLRHKASRLGISDRVDFLPALRNDQVMALLARSDIFVYASEYHELSKGCIEAALTGLPIIVNDRHGDPAEELVGPHVLLVPGTPEGYRNALRKLMENDGFRERLGRAARTHALAHWDPERMERRVTEIYRHILKGAA